MSDEVQLKSEEANESILNKEIKKCRDIFAKQRMTLQEYKMPIIVLIEGFGTAGKGSVIGKVIRDIDPRFFNVISMGSATEDEKRKPFLARHFHNIPEGGKFLFLDSGWMDETIKDLKNDNLSSKDYHKRIESTVNFERQLVDNGYVLIKIFLHISKEEQKKRIKKLSSKKSTSWRVSENDLWQNKNYDLCCKYFNEYIEATDTPFAKWTVLDATHKKETFLNVYRQMVDAIQIAIENRGRPAFSIMNDSFKANPISKLADIYLDDKVIPKNEYEEELEKCQDKLKDIHNKLYRKKIPMVVVYEGFDASGKGGNIKRLTSALDPRGFEVIPIAAPEPHELARHYLWRFWKNVPKTGHITIFDRSWYGRVLVERVEGFCKENDWNRAYGEINEFEKELSDWGAVVLKFWMQIDNKTQLDRFTERQNNPEKVWKITQEDWRNREKWGDYEEAANEMMEKTNMGNAPWHIIESVNKEYARIKVLHLIIDAAEKALKDHESKK